jgi:periplasmic copper chaperone A
MLSGMKPKPVALATALATWVLASAVSAQPPPPSAVSAWVQAPAAGATTAVAYVAINNPTMYDIYITSASADLAGKVEFRAGAARGAEPAVVAEFPVPAYGSTAAEPTAPHLRLVDLKKPLAAGDTVQLTIITDGGVSMKVSAPVK